MGPENNSSNWGIDTFCARARTEKAMDSRNVKVIWKNCILLGLEALRSIC